MSNDLIYRQAAIDALDSIGSLDTDADREYARGIFNALPPAQPKIIRCKDCVHWRDGGAYTYCDKLFGMGVLDVYDYMVEADDFCSMAERKE